MKIKPSFFLNATRLSLGFIFLWAFLDKAFGLGFATKQSEAWISGGSPTAGFLSFATKGPLADFFQMLSGLVIIDWLFMLGLLAIGLAFLFNRYVKWAAYGGAAMMLLMYLSLLLPENNPIIDEHLVYAFIMLYMASLETSSLH